MKDTGDAWRSRRNAATKWKTKPISPKPLEQRGAGGEVFSLQQVMGELEVCRGAELAPCRGSPAPGTSTPPGFYLLPSLHS